MHIDHMTSREPFNDEYVPNDTNVLESLLGEAILSADDIVHARLVGSVIGTGGHLEALHLQVRRISVAGTKGVKSLGLKTCAGWDRLPIPKHMVLSVKPDPTARHMKSPIRERT